MTHQDALSPALTPPHGLELPGPVWGLDPSTHRLAAAVVDAHAPGEVVVGWHTYSYSQAGAMQNRLAAALKVLLRELTELRNQYGTPIAVYLEEPFGGMERFNPVTKKKELVKPHPNAFYFVGVVLTALGHLFADVPVYLIGPPSWKKQALGEGHGFAKKPEIMEWARGVGYTGSLEDEADAIGIATAGGVLEEAKLRAAS